MNHALTSSRSVSLREKVVDYLSLERNVAIASAAVFLLGFGEELWKKFLPKYLEALGASTPIIGLFGTAEDFFDAVYQYPGGWIADHLGRRRAFLIFITLSSAGYVGYLFSSWWPFLFVALALVMAWQSMASPAIFAVIGDSLPRERRAMGFTLQSILKRISDIIIRTCEGMTGVLTILYVTNVAGFSIARYGMLIAIQMTTSILVYIPAGKIADRIGRKPFVIATFLSFALFPIAIIIASNSILIVFAFVIGGLREIGEPARKAMIVDFAKENVRARSVGLYYLVRSLSITPAAATGGLLWKITPQVPFITAGTIGVLGTLVFAVTVEERYAS